MYVCVLMLKLICNTTLTPAVGYNLLLKICWAHTTNFMYICISTSIAIDANSVELKTVKYLHPHPTPVQLGSSQHIFENFSKSIKISFKINVNEQCQNQSQESYTWSFILISPVQRTDGLTYNTLWWHWIPVIPAYTALICEFVELYQKETNKTAAVYTALCGTTEQRLWRKDVSPTFFHQRACYT